VAYGTRSNLAYFVYALSLKGDSSCTSWLFYLHDLLQLSKESGVLRLSSRLDIAADSSVHKSHYRNIFGQRSLVRSDGKQLVQFGG